MTLPQTKLDFSTIKMEHMSLKEEHFFSLIVKATFLLDLTCFVTLKLNKSTNNFLGSSSLKSTPMSKEGTQIVSELAIAFERDCRNGAISTRRIPYMMYNLYNAIRNQKKHLKAQNDMDTNATRCFLRKEAIIQIRNYL
jgi:hypothetical protein